MSENPDIDRGRMLLNVRLREVREQSGMTQVEFAKSLGVALSTYSTYENGHQLPKSDLIIEVCRKHNVSADWLLGLDYEPKIKTEADVLRVLLALKHAGASVSDSLLSFREPEFLDTKNDTGAVLEVVEDGKLKLKTDRGFRYGNVGIIAAYESGTLNSTFDTLQILENNVKAGLRPQSDVENFLEGQIKFLKDKPLSKDTDPKIAFVISKKWQDFLRNE